MGLLGRPVLRTVGFFPRDDGVAEHTDTFDFGFHDIARPEIQRLSILAETSNPGHRASGEDVAGAVAHRGIVGHDLLDRY